MKQEDQGNCLVRRYGDHFGDLGAQTLGLLLRAIHREQ
jgi:hypothetical protein